MPIINQIQGYRHMSIIMRHHPIETKGLASMLRKYLRGDYAEGAITCIEEQAAAQAEQEERQRLAEVSEIARRSIAAQTYRSMTHLLQRRMFEEGE